MEMNRMEGTAKELRGSVKEAIGKVTRNRVKQAEGAAEKLAGRMQLRVLEAADAMRERMKQ
ncbi:CsbD family protein [Burkholderia sp. SRS-W-2-2016]|uniref:CsbD family protein n=1 Tax=Burkholderia sp. SRS-W-2-2016 TaxID=1926878 RepID=UPI00094B1A8D|nr:CsbD family protein [Burkholderia sp. SRS-W-2-2016]OLL28391.1 CsbD family protein [Burkholderia sp. SRS-W-2-2016]